MLSDVVPEEEEEGERQSMLEMGRKSERVLDSLDQLEIYLGLT